MSGRWCSLTVDCSRRLRRRLLIETLLIHMAERPLWEFPGAFKGMEEPARQVWPWILDRSSRRRRGFCAPGHTSGCSGAAPVEEMRKFEIGFL